MNVNDASWIIINYSRVMLQIVASVTDNSRVVIRDRNIFIVQAPGFICKINTVLQIVKSKTQINKIEMI